MKKTIKVVGAIIENSNSEILKVTKYEYAKPLGISWWKDRKWRK